MDLRKIEYLEETKNLIKQAIIEKGGSVSDTDTFRSYAEKISELKTAGENKIAKLFSNQEVELTESDLEGATKINDYQFYQRSYLLSIELPSTVTSIGRNAFTQCSRLRSIKMSENISGTIGTSTFSVCSSLEELFIPSGVKSLSNYAIESCTNLKVIRLGENSQLSSIATGVFSGSLSIELYDFRGLTKIPSSNSDFPVTDNTKMVVPDSLYDGLIVASKFSNIADKIVKASEYVEG